MTPEEIRAAIEYLDACIRELHQDADGSLRSLDDDEQTRFDEGLAERARLAGLLVRAERIEAQATVPGATVPGDDRGVFQHQRKVEAYAGEDLRYLRPGEIRDKALKVLDDTRATEHLGGERAKTVSTPAGDITVTASTRADEVQAHVERLVRTSSKNLDGSQIARRLVVTENDAYRTAFQKLVTQPMPVLTPEESRAVQAFEEVRAMSIGTDASGGFGVPVLIDPSIILTAQGSLNPFRRIARVETITNDEWKGVSSAGVTWSYDAEAATVSDDSPTLGQPNVVAHMARGFIPYSIEVGGDYPGFASEMSTLLMEGYDELQAQAFATGSGSGQPFGIFTALDANTNVEVVVTTDGAFGGVDINKVWGALPDRYKGNATWVMSHDVGNEVATFGNGNNLSFLTVDLTGVAETIRKRPIEYASYAPDFTGTTGASNVLVVGDFRNYLIAERAGMSVELVPHLFDITNNRPTGQRGWFAWARHGADSVNDLGFRLLQNQ